METVYDKQQTKSEQNKQEASRTVSVFWLELLKFKYFHCWGWVCLCLWSNDRTDQKLGGGHRTLPKWVRAITRSPTKQQQQFQEQEHQ